MIHSNKNEMKPSIDVVKKLAEELVTTVGYLLGEAKESLLLKDPIMLKRFQEINVWKIFQNCRPLNKLNSLT